MSEIATLETLLEELRAIPTPSPGRGVFERLVEELRSEADALRRELPSPPEIRVDVPAAEVRVDISTAEVAQALATMAEIISRLIEAVAAPRTVTVVRDRNGLIESATVATA